MRTAIRRILAVSVYGIVCVLFLELVVRLVLATPFMTRHRRFQDDLSWRRWWVRVHHPGQTMLYGFDRHDETKGWMPKPNLRDVPAFGDKLLSTNSRGLRGREEHAPAKRPGVSRVVILGDSFTFGDEVDDTETYPYYLQRLLPGTEVVNMGVHGYGHDQMLILFREEGVRLSPDVVVLGFVEADMSRNLRFFRDYAKPRFTLVGDELRLGGSPVPPPEAILRTDWARPRLWDLWSILTDELRRATGWERRERETLTTRLLREIVSTARDLRAVPIIVYLPTQTEIADPAPTTAGERYLLAACATVGAATCVSSRPALVAARARGITFGTTRHWNAAGHRVVAETIAEHLARATSVELPSRRR